MFRYLKAAFFVRSHLSGLGEIPINVLMVLGFVILGIGHPGFWLLGIALETAFLFGLSTNKRFQNWVEAQSLMRVEKQAELKRQSLINQLTPKARNELAALEKKSAKIIQVSRNLQTDDFVLKTNRDALRKLLWMYLKLLIARHQLESPEGQVTEEALRRQITDLNMELQDEGLSSSVRESKEATLVIVEKRLENLHRREQSLQEIDSDLIRIEAQIDLALEDATMRHHPRTISTSIEVASQLLDLGFYGDSESTVAELEDTFG